MILKKLLNLNFLFIFIIILLMLIGTAALYSAGQANLYPWAEKHFVRFVFLSSPNQIPSKTIVIAIRINQILPKLV